MYIPEKMANSRMYEDNKTLSRRAEVYKECCKEVKRYYRHVPHSWIWGYAHYKKTVHPRGNMKLYYAMLFIRYNFNSPSYTATCVKKYLKMKQNARYQEKNENSPLLAAPSGRYSDGWMAKSYTLAIQYVGNETELVLYGRNPHMYRDKMVLTITLDDKKKQDFELENASTMGCIMELPNLRGAGIMNVKIDASETYVPKEVEKSKDTRELSVIIDNVFLR